MEKSARPSASLKSHRNFEISFWNYMSTFLLWTIQDSPTRSRVTRPPSASFKSHRIFEIIVFSIVDNTGLPNAFAGDPAAVGLLKEPQKF